MFVHDEPQWKCERHYISYSHVNSIRSCRKFVVLFALEASLSSSRLCESSIAAFENFQYVVCPWEKVIGISIDGARVRLYSKHFLFTYDSKGSFFQKYIAEGRLYRLIRFDLHSTVIQKKTTHPSIVDKIGL